MTGEWILNTWIKSWFRTIYEVQLLKYFIRDLLKLNPSQTTVAHLTDHFEMFVWQNIINVLFTWIDLTHHIIDLSVADSDKLRYMVVWYWKYKDTFMIKRWSEYKLWDPEVCVIFWLIQTQCLISLVTVHGHCAVKLRISWKINV